MCNFMLCIFYHHKIKTSIKKSQRSKTTTTKKMEPHTPSGGILWGPTVSMFFGSIYVSPTLAARTDAELGQGSADKAFCLLALL